MRINILYIIKTLGSILILETIFLLIATGVAFIYGGSDRMPVLISSGIMLGAGLIFFITGRKADEYHAGRREGMLTVTLTWVILSFFGMMPFYIGGYIDHITDAYLETMSGFTTTGVTVLDDIESLPRGILFWRSLMQWQGGIGMVVFTVALLPMFGGSASQLFDAETTGFSHERFRPRVTQVAKRLSGVYVLLTLLLTVLLWIGPMDFYEALNYAMGSISTGGYSTKNASIAYWNSPYIEYVIMFGMCIGGMKLPLFFFVLKGKFKQFLNDEETRWYLIYLLFFILVTVAWLFCNGYETAAYDIENTIRKGAFQVISLATTTGFITADFVAWGPFYWLIAIFLMLICGCGGSTSGGLKMGRALILAKNMLNEFRKQTHPAAVLPVRVNGRAISQETIYRVHIFALVYVLLICFSWIFLLVNGLTFEEAIGTSISAISNVGPSLGSLADGNLSTIPAVSKWYVSFLMMAGRLEIFTVLTLLLPGFWRR
ncbi:MAG: TrkH family potassium uptake protein [Tannerella sp.]|jgi:trk system potassium uptake protein TrkH|nr:TrkH family potassium uptake protein [Tannerella sp.]